ncbi:MAG: hypothetical protein K6A42_03100 [Treponema sp.]|nr:hypothetical protein [Treponema sp.]
MKKNLYFIFIAASFALLAAAPGRLAYGLPLIIELNLLVVASTTFNSLAKKFDLGYLHEILTLAFIIFLVILYRQILILYSPVVALTLSFALFLPAASAYLLGSVYSSQTNSISQNASSCGLFSIFALFFFMFRDIAGFGTLSLPIPNGIKEIVLFDARKTHFLSFFATIPGALLIFVFFMSLLLTIQNRISVIEKSEENDGNN